MHKDDIFPAAFALILAALCVLGLSGCYLENRESLRQTYAEPDVLDQVQATADSHPLANWTSP